ncbi:hypothetical protein GpartN1_g885.t1 [Galdieria partita]|uniref:U1-type domain-containing protein n=1 Tax=Galdieria partita TaxID=83374 RepID=A0A9C7PRV0_9RHOD|nr:hypothetical protein GpartN1_g885.t1 [Galdieria partita]
MIKRLCWNVVNQDDASDSEDEELVIRKLSENYKAENLSSLGQTYDDYFIPPSDPQPNRKPKKASTVIKRGHHSSWREKENKGNCSTEEYSQERTSVDSYLYLKNTTKGTLEEQGIVFKEKKRKRLSSGDDEEIDSQPSRVRTCRLCKDKLLLNDTDVQQHIMSKKHRKAFSRYSTMEANL